jgi:hypothetical protein
MKYALAFDIERSGALPEHQTIAIGACVVNEAFEKVDELLLVNYRPDETKFEQRCWDEFWSKHSDVLDALQYTGLLTLKEQDKHMITELQVFRAKWEERCDANADVLVLVSDNNVFDGGYINQLIHEHLPGKMPIPYSAGKQEYDTFLEVHSMQGGLLMAVDPTFTSDWSFGNRIAELYDLPEKQIEHDHNPVNDAYTIGYDYMILMGIRDGRIHRKP